jgi:hypothetical protein
VNQSINYMMKGNICNQRSISTPNQTTDPLSAHRIFFIQEDYTNVHTNYFGFIGRWKLSTSSDNWPRRCGIGRAVSNSAGWIRMSFSCIHVPFWKQILKAKKSSDCPFSCGFIVALRLGFSSRNWSHVHAAVVVPTRVRIKF